MSEQVRSPHVPRRTSHCANCAIPLRAPRAGARPIGGHQLSFISVPICGWQSHQNSLYKPFSMAQEETCPPHPTEQMILCVSVFFKFIYLMMVTDCLCFLKFIVERHQIESISYDCTCIQVSSNFLKCSTVVPLSFVADFEVLTLKFTLNSTCIVYPHGFNVSLDYTWD